MFFRLLISSARTQKGKTTSSFCQNTQDTAADSVLSQEQPFSEPSLERPTRSRRGPGSRYWCTFHLDEAQTQRIKARALIFAPCRWKMEMWFDTPPTAEMRFTCLGGACI